MSGLIGGRLLAIRGTWRFNRMLPLTDEPDEIHEMVLARRELNRWSKRDEAEAAGKLDSKHAPRMV